MVKQWYTKHIKNPLLQTSKLSLKKIFGIAVAWICFSGIVVFFFIFLKPTASIIVPLPAVQDVVRVLSLKDSRPGLPIRLIIPAISVNAPVEYVGIASDGTMEVPKGPDDVAWFNLGSRPGEGGSAVIAGHSGWKNGTPAVFDNLYLLKKGDKIFSEDEQGKVTTFIVRGTGRYGPKEDASLVFGLVPGKPHLNLITCEGASGTIFKSYSSRLVIFTDQEVE